MRLTSRYNIIVFGIELNKGGKTCVMLNPGRFKMRPESDCKVFAYIIAPDKETAEKVA